MKYRYIDVYYSRVNHLGETTAERIKNAGELSFQRWLDDSPYTVNNLSVERGIHFRAIIQQNKDKESKKIMTMHVANDVAIVVGDVLNWQVEDGSYEKWILFQKEKKVNGTYQTFLIVRCNFFLKWFDELGHLQKSWVYLVSSMDKEIKGNYRTWHNLITPQPNKYMEIMMPRFNITRSTNFIVESESWTLIEYDYTSVPGIIYLSLAENKANQIYDDLDNDIADLDKEARYELLVPEETQIFTIGEVINPIYTLTKNGQVCDLETVLAPNDKKVAKIVRGELIAVAEGETDIIVKLKDFPLIQKTIHIIVADAAKNFVAYIEGAASIRLGRKNSYELKATEAIEGAVTYAITSKFATIVSVENNICEIQANSKNELGEFELTATYNGVEYKKVIQVVPLW